MNESDMLRELERLVHRSNRRFGSRTPGPESLRRSASEIVTGYLSSRRGVTWDLRVQCLGARTRIRLTLDGDRVHYIPDIDTLEIMEASRDEAG